MEDRIWVLTDGRAGNEAQALGLARALVRARPGAVEIRRLALARWAARLPSRALDLIGRVRPFAGVAGGRAELAPPWPRLVIGAGRRAAPAVAAMRRAGVVAVQLLDPQMPPGAFDAVVVPAHDSLRGPNVIESVGALSGPTLAEIAAAAEPWRARLADLPTPRLAVLVGGPSGSAGFTEADGAALVRALEALAPSHGLMITPSRRTPPALCKALEGVGGFLWNGSGDNPYPGILGLADAVLVTADSVNMASEAASTGRPVHVFPVTSLAPKLQRFHAALQARGASRPFNPSLPTWTYEPLAEPDRVAALLIARNIW